MAQEIINGQISQFRMDAPVIHWEQVYIPPLICNLVDPARRMDAVCHCHKENSHRAP